jgi:hypothetical protein
MLWKVPVFLAKRTIIPPDRSGGKRVSGRVSKHENRALIGLESGHSGRRLTPIGRDHGVGMVRFRLFMLTPASVPAPVLLEIWEDSGEKTVPKPAGFTILIRYWENAASFA